ncbi:hypothetical protein DRE_01561 [Drechslerella stenobrocha 248]|uniref:Uncharacterized protein n=1 Tax=Drechslerella stenobrocha 248 TaxID=1043628 RepID=W7HKY1_9PEZI|nr:hypothetical protein DRE_01561 [Drechslerella stenobrocha 248]
MATSTLGLGLALPITSLALPAFATYYSLLSYRVTATRVATDVFIGTKPDPKAKGLDPLTIAIRSHGNFNEYVPLALTLTAIAELNGANPTVIATALGSLFVIRVGHVELGLRGANALGRGRIIGFLGTLAYLVGMSGYAAWLARGYLGFD